MTTQADVELSMTNQWMCVTSLKDPDGYDLHFASPTDAPEESEFDG